jgi:glycosyltransferase involved in cell wall biosynthesis
VQLRGAVRGGGVADLSVLFCTEGTYPFVEGGVGTWCDIICRELPQVEFTLYAVTGSPEVSYKFDPPPNARRVVHVPLFGTRDPSEAFGARRERASEQEIDEVFVPLLRRLLEGLDVEGAEIRDYGVVVYELWRWFGTHEWRQTWKSRPVYEAFAAYAATRARPGEVPTVGDVDAALGWLHAFFAPLAAPVPRSDLVHATIAGFAALPGIVAKHRDGTPFLVTEHGVYVRERYISVSTSDFSQYAKRFLMSLTGFVARLVYAHADLVAPVVAYNQRWELPFGVDASRISAIYNGVDPGLFLPRPRPRDAPAGPVAVAAARIFPLKDIETMIRSAAVARELVPGIRYLVYGSLDADVPYVERCLGLVRELGLEETFELRGFHSNPAELYAEGDICVLSSISEAFPYTVLESMACARPVVGTDVGGVREALDGFGIVVPPRDPEAFGRAVARMFDDDEFRRELGRRAREEVLAKYRTSDSVNAYWAAYLELTGRVAA